MATEPAINAQGILSRLDSAELIQAEATLLEFEETPAYRLLWSLWEAERLARHHVLENHLPGGEPAYARIGGEARGLSLAVGMAKRVHDAARVAEQLARETRDYEEAVA